MEGDEEAIKVNADPYGDQHRAGMEINLKARTIALGLIEKAEKSLDQIQDWNLADEEMRVKALQMADAYRQLAGTAYQLGSMF